jgi:hypothetical protein
MDEEDAEDVLEKSIFMVTIELPGVPVALPEQPASIAVVANIPVTMMSFMVFMSFLLRTL